MFGGVIAIKKNTVSYFDEDLKWDRWIQNLVAVGFTPLDFPLSVQ